MSLLTQRALHVYSVLEADRGADDDIVDALLLFFEPVLSDLAGKIYDPTQFAERVRSSYRGWRFTADVAEELIPRFERRGWLKKIGQSRAQDHAYQITYSGSSATPSPTGSIAIGEALAQITAEFQTFIDEISPLTSYSRTQNELSDLLVEWLVSIDAYNEDLLRQHIKKFDIGDSGRLGAAEVIASVSPRLGTEDQYLCARFVRKLFKENSPWLSELCRLASIGLLTEVIQDFSKPTSAVKRSDLAIYLDGPVALDALGLSGEAAAANVRLIMSELVRIGCKIHIFRVTVNEIRGALRAMLGRPRSDRLGATADAIRRGEVLERYAASVRDRPEEHLREQGITVVDQTLDQFPHSHDHFSESLNQDLYSAIKWHVEVAPRNHDATVLTLIMRRRTGTQTHDVFQAKHLFVTKSGYLSQVSRRFCIEHDLIHHNQVPPAIHQRQLATMMWLRTGLGEKDEVPKRYLLAACERVLELRRGIVERARHAVASLSRDQQDQLELLLAEDRSVQMMMDKTLGSFSVINESNISQLIEAMKRSLAADIEKDKRKEVAEIRRSAKAKISAADEARRLAERREAAIADQLSLAGDEDRGMIEAVIRLTNLKVRNFRWFLNGFVSLFMFVIFAIPLMTEMSSGVLKYSLLISSGLVAAIMGGFQIWDRKTGLYDLVRRYSEDAFRKLVRDRGLERRLSNHPVLFESNRFRLAQQPTPVIGRQLFK